MGSVISALTTQLVQKSIELKTRELDNIQVIIFRNDKYEISIIPKRSLEVIRNCHSSFEAITKAFVKIKDENIVVYEEVLHNFLFGINQYWLMNKLLRYPLDSIWFLRHILKIQIYTRGGNKMTAEKEYKKAWVMSSHGFNLREEIPGSDRGKNFKHNQAANFTFR